MADILRPRFARHLTHILCTNCVEFTELYKSKMKAIVFTDTTTAPGKNYIWITATEVNYQEGQYYDISAECDERHILNRVVLVKDYAGEAKSEQPDAYDVLFGNANYTDKNLTND